VTALIAKTFGEGFHTQNHQPLLFEEEMKFD
jgi:hypothetical protein